MTRLALPHSFGLSSGLRPFGLGVVIGSLAVIAASVPALAQDCTTRVSAESMTGRAVISVSAPCRTPGEVFTVSYALADGGYAVNVEGKLDSLRLGVLPISLFQSSTKVTVNFQNGETQTLTVPFSDGGGPALETLTKLGVIWKANVDIDLKVIEPGKPDAGTTAAKMDVTSDGSGGGDHIETYTIPTNTVPRFLSAYLALGARQVDAQGVCHPPEAGDIQITAVAIIAGKLHPLDPMAIHVGPGAAWNCPVAGKRLDLMTVKKLAEIGTLVEHAK